jgi:hypothetical protein
MRRSIFWILFLAAFALTLGLKAAQLGWFDPRPPLELGDEPALLFFNKTRGCECELLVYNNANAQMDNWNAPITVHAIDLDRRPDLGQQYGVIRAPALVLVNVDGQVAWKQDNSLSDGAPLDLKQAETEIKVLLQNP